MPPEKIAKRTYDIAGVVAGLMLGFSILLSGCDSNAEVQRDLPTGTETVNGRSSTVHELMTSGSDDFAKASAGIRSGDDLPYMMGYDISSDWGMMAVSDSKIVAMAWDRLTNLSLIGPDHAAPPIDDEMAQFTFVWADGTKIAFSFVTSDWFRGPDQQMYYVINSDVVSTLMQEARQAAVPVDTIERPKPASPAQERDRQQQTASYGKDWEYEGKGLTDLSKNLTQLHWDMDGDGDDESILLAFIDNGDKTRGGYELTMDRDDKPAKGWIDGAYTVNRIQGGVDATGPFLLLTYEHGDAYGMYGTEQSLIRLDADGELIVTVLRDGS